MVIAAAPVAAAPVPPPVPPPVAPPVAAPTPVPVPAPPKAWSQVKLEADSLFGFDQDRLQADGENALDQLIRELRQVTVDTIKVTGHTDRLGSRAYNAKLSQRRAQAVKNYLVQSGGFQAHKITAMGVGSTQAETLSSDCQSLQATRALITCLRVDRRVEVTVTGTQQQP